MGLLEPRGCSAGSQEWEPQPGTEEVNVHLPPNVNVSR